MQGANPYYYPPSGLSANVIDLGISSLPNIPTSDSNLRVVPSHPENYVSGAMSKKRKVDRACDACRRRKTKCDGHKMPQNVCTNCIQSRKTCTYVEASKPRGPSKAYVTGLEDRLEKMEALLKRLRPESEFLEELGPPVIRDSWKAEETSSGPAYIKYKSQSPTVSLLARECSTPSSCSSTIQTLTPSLHPYSNGQSPSPTQAGPSSLTRSTHLMFRSQPRARRPRIKIESSEANHLSKSDSDSSSDFLTSSDTDALVESFAGGLQRLTLHKKQSTTEEGASQARFHGKSSSLKLIEATRQFKEQHIQEVMERGASDRGESTPPSNGVVHRPMRRSEYWRTPPWELTWEGLNEDSPPLMASFIQDFPPQDLSKNLLDLYFTHINTQFPLLHRPTFDRQWKGALYHSDDWFACLCFSIFAVASRWCDDPRVLPEPMASGEMAKRDWTRAGWGYFDIALDIHRVRRSLIYPPGLFEVQTFPLLGMFLRGSVDYPVAWLMISIGIRKAQDVGAHRKKVYDYKPSVDEELWKRAFWLLVASERIECAILGRPCSVGEEDFDIDLPLEVDDEYWETEDPSLAFQQPPGKPAIVSAFNLWLKLTQIVAFALKTIYAIDQSKVLPGVVIPRWREQVVSQLETVLAEWRDSIPTHLKWSDNMENRVFAGQAATLCTSYHLVQILIYRPFIPPPLPLPSSSPSSDGNQGRTHNPHPAHESPFPAQAMCTNAAKSCARIVENQLLRGVSYIPTFISASHLCAATLLVNVWDLKVKEKLQQGKGIEDVKPPLAQTIESLLDHVKLFMKALEWAEPRWHTVTPWLQKLRDSLPTTDMDDPVYTQPTTIPDHPHHPPSVDRISVPRIPRQSYRAMASSLEGLSTQYPYHSDNTTGWQWYAAATEVPINAYSHTPPPSQSRFQQAPPHGPPGFLKKEPPQLHAFPDEGAMQTNPTPQYPSFPIHGCNEWSPSQSSSSHIRNHTSPGVLYPDSFVSNDGPPASMCATHRPSSSSHRNRDLGCEVQYHDSGYHHDLSRNAGTKSYDDVNIHSGDDGGQRVYYQAASYARPTPRPHSQANWDKGGPRFGEGRDPCRTNHSYERSNHRDTWPANMGESQFPQAPTRPHATHLEHEYPQEPLYPSSYTI